ncbi:MAG TPA: MBL fold metallo-hydrolase [Chloroflexia bacterium]|nr:MBL fold metallo-hydrolase [Chloroflexia bacterium]
MSILVDGKLAIDAGGLTTALTLEEQANIEAILVTHKHFDHVKDLVGLAHNNWQVRSLHIHCIDDTRDALQAHIFNDVLWPTMSEQIGPYYPLTWHRVEAGAQFDLLGYSITPIEMSHSVPTVGYFIQKDGASFFYTADTRAQGNPSWAAIRPDLLIAETTMANEHERIATMVGHMTPATLGSELRAFHAKQGYYPPTVCVHINPHQEPTIIPELTALASELGAEITPGHEGMVLTVSRRS